MLPSGSLPGRNKKEEWTRVSTPLAVEKTCVNQLELPIRRVKSYFSLIGG